MKYRTEIDVLYKEEFEENFELIKPTDDGNITINLDGARVILGVQKIDTEAISIEELQKRMDEFMEGMQ